MQYIGVAPKKEGRRSGIPRKSLRRKAMLLTDSKVIRHEALPDFFSEKGKSSSHGELGLNPSLRFELKASTSSEKVSRNCAPDRG